MSGFGRLLGRGTNPPPPPDNAAQRDRLEALLASHGMATLRADGWIGLPQQEMAAAAYLTSDRPTTCELEVRLGLPDGRAIVESFAGVGADPAVAEQDAWRNFVLGSFHVLLRGILLPGADEQVDVEEWVVRGERYRVVIGAATHRGIPSVADLPAGWFPALQSAITEAGIENDLSWVRFFYGQVGGRTALEVLLNNEPWDTVADAMGALPWPVAEEHYSVRLFLTLSRI